MSFTKHTIQTAVGVTRWRLNQKHTMSKNGPSDIHKAETNLFALFERNKLPEHLKIYIYTSTCGWQIDGTKCPWEVYLCVCMRQRKRALSMCLSSHRKQKDQINPFMFISSSLYPLASISPSSQHQLMCVALKSNLYHLMNPKPLSRMQEAPYQLTSCYL